MGNLGQPPARPPIDNLGTVAANGGSIRPLAARILRGTAARVRARLEAIAAGSGAPAAVGALGEGKMLRTSLAAHLLEDGAGEELVGRVVRACAATELVHSASLLHDDVIDGGSVRRGRPTLWRDIGTNAAVLAGDVFFCEALEEIGTVDDCGCMKAFVRKVKEVCLSEVEQELCVRGRAVEHDRALAVARGKTGPLFSFVALVCAGDDAEKRSVFEEVGYEIGTAYQLADDLLDEKGEGRAGKTLGTDRLRRKFTLAQTTGDPERLIGGHVKRLCLSAVDRLRPWPGAQRGIRLYLAVDFEAAALLRVQL